MLPARPRPFAHTTCLPVCWCWLAGLSASFRVPTSVLYDQRARLCQDGTLALQVSGRAHPSSPPSLS